MYLYNLYSIKPFINICVFGLRESLHRLSVFLHLKFMYNCLELVIEVYCLAAIEFFENNCMLNIKNNVKLPIYVLHFYHNNINLIPNKRNNAKRPI